MPAAQRGSVPKPMHALLAVPAALALIAQSAAARAQPRPGYAPPALVRVPLEPPPIDTPDAPARAGERRRCVAAEHIQGATVLGNRTIELLLDDGERLHMSFAAACPFIGFYGGFYYRRSQAGRLCAGHDSVIDRSGGACRIEDIRRHRAPRP